MENILVYIILIVFFGFGLIATLKDVREKGFGPLIIEAIIIFIVVGVFGL